MRHKKTSRYFPVGFYTNPNKIINQRRRLKRLETWQKEVQFQVFSDLVNDILVFVDRLQKLKPLFNSSISTYDMIQIAKFRRNEHLLN